MAFSLQTGTDTRLVIILRKLYAFCCPNSAVPRDAVITVSLVDNLLAYLFSKKLFFAYITYVCVRLSPYSYKELSFSGTCASVRTQACNDRKIIWDVNYIPKRKSSITPANCKT